MTKRYSIAIPSFMVTAFAFLLITGIPSFSHAVDNDLSGPCFAWGATVSCEQHLGSSIQNDSCDGCTGADQNGDWWCDVDTDGLQKHTNDGNWTQPWTAVQSVSTGQNLDSTSVAHVCYWTYDCFDECGSSVTGSGSTLHYCEEYVEYPHGWWQYGLTGTCEYGGGGGYE